MGKLREDTCKSWDMASRTTWQVGTTWEVGRHGSYDATTFGHTPLGRHGTSHTHICRYSALFPCPLTPRMSTLEMERLGRVA